MKTQQSLSVWDGNSTTQSFLSVWDEKTISGQQINNSMETSTYTNIEMKRNAPEWVQRSLLRTSGTESWTINQVPDYPDYECRWIEYKATSGNNEKLCGHRDPDGVTDTIEKDGNFRHCDILPKLWDKAKKDENSIYLEIGANIGSCVMEMLLSTEAKIILFEPHPKNLFCIKNTVSVLDSKYQDRVVIVPVALGATSETNTIFAAKGNMGNSIVGKSIKDMDRDEFPKEDQHTIFVERLDSIVSSKNVNVPLTKMDAQGFECNVLSGMNQELADTLQLVKFEVARRHLGAQGCDDLLNRFRSKGFDIRKENGELVDGEWQQFYRMMELHAVRQN